MITCNFCAAEADQFYTSANQDGSWGLYCNDCYKKLIVDKYDGIIPHPANYNAIVCECGTKAKLGANHSSWCNLYMDEF
jgi:hypothetical protein